ncbi:MAG: DUF465 domain-containing protein [Alphaproteobacteria bacterium]|nr:DUF465 domain-containing protein [Alphaproteobacteria bacterium]MBV8548852.1 DUF465 domain-containing protein [Alphaproteobacteria bacterium]
MALAQRLDSLVKRHADVDLRILAETSRPLPDTAILHQLKKQKLSLKDGINFLMSEIGQTA